MAKSRAVQFENIRKMDKVFKELGASKEFLDISVIKKEMDVIERNIGEHLYPIRLFLKRYSFDDLNTSLKSKPSTASSSAAAVLSSQAGPSTPQATTTAAAASTVSDEKTLYQANFITSLTNLISCPDGELMYKCLDK